MPGCETSERVVIAVERIVLLGLMGAGKSTVGPRLARRLGWRYVDLDREIERRAGQRVAEIFAGRGEAYFRLLETACTVALAGCRQAVLAPGGGWIATPGNLARLGPGSFRIWLQVGPDEALARLAGSPEARPLLAAADPLAAATRLLEEREPLYRQAELAVATGGRTPAEVVHEIVEHLRERGLAAAREV